MKSSSLLSALLSVALVAASTSARADDATGVSTTTDASGISVSVIAPPPSHVHLSGPTPGLSLDRRTGVTTRSGIVTDEQWQSVCRAPCDATLPADGLYRVSAPDTVPQYVPHLHGQDAELNADLRGSSAQTVGVTLALVGVGAIVAGSLLFAVEGTENSQQSPFQKSQGSVSYAPAIITMSASLPLLIVGVAVASAGQGSLTVSMHDAVPTVSLGDGLLLSPTGLLF